MTEVTQADVDRANHIVEQAALDIENGNQGGVEWLAAILSVYRDEDYAAGKADERERRPGIADDHVLTADDDVQEAYARSAIDIAVAIRSET